MMSRRRMKFLAAVGGVLFAVMAAVYIYAVLRHSDPDPAIASQPEAGGLPEIAPAAGGDDSDNDAPDDDSDDDSRR